MEKIVVVGCPGSGKTTLSKKIQAILGYKILHLDYIYHIDNHTHITEHELKASIREFVDENKFFIIDGTYSTTLEYRLQFCDTVIFYHIDQEICSRNVIKRLSLNQRDDMAPGFDNSIMDDDFLDYIRDFDKVHIPLIKTILKKYPHIKVIDLYNYEEANSLVESLR